MMFVCVSERGIEQFLKRGDWGQGLSLSWFGRADSDRTQCSHSSRADCTMRRGGEGVVLMFGQIPTVYNVLPIGPLNLKQDRAAVKQQEQKTQK